MNAQILELFKRYEALITNTHVVYTSGRHGDTYVNKDALYPHTEALCAICRTLAEHFLPFNPEVVLSPALGGIVLGQWTAYHLSRQLNREVLSVYAEKRQESSTPTAEKNRFILKRGYDKLVHGKRVLVLEDIVNTGGSVKDIIKLAQQTQAQVIGVGVLCDRSPLQDNVAQRILELCPQAEFFALCRLQLSTYDAQHCPLCQQNIPIHPTLGKGSPV